MSNLKLVSKPRHLLDEVEHLLRIDCPIAVRVKLREYSVDRLLCDLLLTQQPISHFHYELAHLVFV